MKKNFASEVSKPIAYTSDEALDFYVNGGFSKHSYELMQTGGKKWNIYPLYDALLLAKKCCPIGVEITNRSAEVSLQSLVDHAVRRIVEMQKDCFVNINEDLQLFMNGDVMVVVDYPLIGNDFLTINRFK